MIINQNTLPKSTRLARGQKPTSCTLFYPVPVGGEADLSVGYTVETTAWLAALNGEKGRAYFVREDDGFLWIYVDGGRAYRGCSMKQDDEAARREVMDDVGTYLSREAERFYVTTVEVEFDAEGSVVSVNGDSDDVDLLTYYSANTPSLISNEHAPIFAP